MASSYYSRPSYLEKLIKIKNNLVNNQEKDEDKDKDYQQKISDEKEKIQTARESSKQSQENIQDCQNRCDTTIEDISEDKSLAKMNKKQNMFLKVFAKIKDRIGGKEKFTKNVIEPLKNKTTHIKEEVLPAVKDKIQHNVMPKLKSLLEKEKTNAKNLNENFNKLMIIAKEGARNIAEKSSVVKARAISAFSTGLSMTKEVVSKVAEKVADVIESTNGR